MSGRYEHARRFAKSKGITLLHWISGDEQMRGLRDITVYVLPSAYSIVNFDRMMSLARIQGFKMIHVRG